MRQTGTVVRHVSVLIDLRGVLGGVIVRLLKDAYGSSAVSEVPVGVRLGDAVTRARPHVLITALNPEEDPALVPAALAQLLDDHPRLRILVVEGDGRLGSVWELRPHRIPLGELSARHIIQLVHEAAHRS